MQVWANESIQYSIGYIVLFSVFCSTFLTKTNRVGTDYSGITSFGPLDSLNGWTNYQSNVGIRSREENRNFYKMNLKEIYFKSHVYALSRKST